VLLGKAKRHAFVLHGKKAVLARAIINEPAVI